jgi:hypothetical protein
LAFTSEGRVENRVFGFSVCHFYVSHAELSVGTLMRKRNQADGGLVPEENRIIEEGVLSAWQFFGGEFVEEALVALCETI